MKIQPIKRDKFYKIEDFWTVDDVKSIDSTLTIESCCIVLDFLKKNHDAEIGINWDVIKNAIENLDEQNMLKYSKRKGGK